VRKVYENVLSIAITGVTGATAVTSGGGKCVTGRNYDGLEVDYVINENKSHESE